MTTLFLLNRIQNLGNNNDDIILIVKKYLKDPNQSIFVKAVKWNTRSRTKKIETKVQEKRGKKITSRDIALKVVFLDCINVHNNLAGFGTWR